jgi:hypothetical protein
MTPGTEVVIATLPPALARFTGPDCELREVTLGPPDESARVTVLPDVPTVSPDDRLATLTAPVRALRLLTPAVVPPLADQ